MGEAGRPLVVSGEQVRQREFATVRRGYDPDQVRAFLASVADHVDAISRALDDARARVASLEAAEQGTTQEGTPAAEETDPYEQLSKRFAGVLATADNEAERIVDQARTEAERIKLEAQTRAEEVRIRSSQSLIAAQQESDRMLVTLAERREAMLRQLHEMQSRLLSVAEDLEVAIQPSDVVEAPASAPPPTTPTTPSPAPSPAPASTKGSTPGPTTSSPNAGAMPTPSPAPARAPATTATDAGETAAPVDDLWVTTDRPAPADAGLAGLFDEPSTDDIDLPDLSGIDIDVDDER